MKLSQKKLIKEYMLRFAELIISWEDIEMDKLAELLEDIFYQGFETGKENK